MTLDKAIELLADEAESPRYTYDPDRRDAMKLGIEALRYVQNSRHYPENPFDNLLPGETKD